MTKADIKRVTFHRDTSHWWISCVRCPWEYRQPLPVDTTSWCYEVQHHPCNASFYTDHDRANSRALKEARA